MENNILSDTWFLRLDGEILPYDACGSNENIYDSRVFEYIGRGHIIVVGGGFKNYIFDPEDESTADYFFQYKDEYKYLRSV